jgi:hypothetical protein
MIYHLAKYKEIIIRKRAEINSVYTTLHYSEYRVQSTLQCHMSFLPFGGK